MAVTIGADRRSVHDADQQLTAAGERSRCTSVPSVRKAAFVPSEKPGVVLVRVDDARLDELAGVAVAGAWANM